MRNSVALAVAAVVALCFTAQGQTQMFPLHHQSTSTTPGITANGNVATKIFDAIFFETEGQAYQTNSYWWADSGVGMTKVITFFASAPFEVTSIRIQADCGETMNVYYREPHTQSWKVYGSLPARTCPGLREGTISIVTPLADAFYIGCSGSDLLCSVSRFIPFGYDAPTRFTDSFTSTSAWNVVRYDGTVNGASPSQFYNAVFPAEGSSTTSNSIHWTRSTSDVRVFFELTQPCTIRSLHVDADCDDSYVVEVMNYDTGLYEPFTTFGPVTPCTGMAVREYRSTNPAHHVAMRVYCTGGDGNCAISRAVMRGWCEGPAWITPLFTQAATTTGPVSNGAALTQVYSVNTLSEHTVWTQGVYWNRVDPVTITTPFVWGCTVERVMILADCNDRYPLEYWTGSTWQNFYTVPQSTVGGCGLRMRVFQLAFPFITTTKVRVNGCLDDNLCGVSRLMMFGACPITPDPSTVPPTTLPPITALPLTAAPSTSPPLTTSPVTAAPLTQPPQTTAPTTLAPRTLPQNACCQENIDVCYALLDQCDAIDCGTAPTVSDCTALPVLCTVYNACQQMLNECVESTAECTELLSLCE